MNGKIVRFLASCFSILPRTIRFFLYDCIKNFSGVIFSELRYIFISKTFKKIGTGVYIGPNVTIKNSHKLSLGSRISIHDFTYIDAYGSIEIGNDVSIAHNCTIISSAHTWGNKNLPIRNNPVRARPVKIGNNIWLGCDVRILGGIDVASDCIIGAGAVVTKSCESNSIYHGSPAKFIKQVYNNNLSCT